MRAWAAFIPIPLPFQKHEENAFGDSWSSGLGLDGLTKQRWISWIVQRPGINDLAGGLAVIDTDVECAGMELFNQVGSNAGYELPHLDLLLDSQLEQTRHMSPWHDERVAFAEREGVAKGEGRGGGGNDGGGGAEGTAICHDD